MPSQGNCEVVDEVKCLNCWRHFSGPDCTLQDFIYDNRIDLPMIVTDGGSWVSSIPTIKLEGLVGDLNKSQQFVLFDNRYNSPAEGESSGYHRIWDITPLRDMATCGFYVQPGAVSSSSTDGIAPSFFQRMVNGVEFPSSGLRSAPYGIESFVVGKWAGGKDDPAHEGYSRLDWEFYSRYGGSVDKIKGMPGCKNAAMCDQSNEEPVKLSVGKFWLSKPPFPNNAIERYGLEDLMCSAQDSASCNVIGGNPNPQGAQGAQAVPGAQGAQ
jgi:hypothetical protein